MLTLLPLSEYSLKGSGLFGHTWSTYDSINLSHSKTSGKNVRGLGKTKHKHSGGWEINPVNI